MKSEEIRSGKPEVQRLEWWEVLTPGERKLICSLMRMLRGAKRSQLQEVAMAAAKWERGIGCFIKVRLMNDRKTRLTISCRSTSRTRPGASQDRD
ncbi:MAG: hypothetical protein P4N60_11515 [Verrucomicrobiae bacterium]|nr:hypothetical protein [Verrucomicrobiae bacterium]